MYKKAILFGVTGGLILYLFTIIEDIAYCTYASSRVGSSMMYIYFLLGILVAVIVILYKIESFKTAAVRFAAMLALYMVCVVVGGSIQLIPFLRNVLGIEVSSYVDNVSGMVQLTFLTAAAAGSVIALIAAFIKSICRKRSQ